MKHFGNLGIEGLANRAFFIIHLLGWQQHIPSFSFNHSNEHIEKTTVHLYVQYIM